MAESARRREKARRLCRMVAERVGRIATPGLGRWPPAWEIVEEPSVRFLDELHAWEATGSKERIAAVEDATRGLLAAWKEADRRFLAGERQKGPMAANEGGR